MHKHHVARCVSRTVDNVQHLLADGHGITLLQPAVGGKDLCRRKAGHLAGLGQLLQPEIIFPVRPLNRYIQLLAQYIRGRTVVHVGVGENYFLDTGLHLLDRCQNTLNIPARIDDGGARRGLTFNNGTVLLIGRHRDDSTLNGHRQVLISIAGSWGKDVCLSTHGLRPWVEARHYCPCRRHPDWGARPETLPHRTVFHCAPRLQRPPNRR